MRRIRLVSIAALIAAGSVALAACGSSGGGTTSSSAPRPAAARTRQLDRGGGDAGCASGTLNAAGSTAQANAMDAWRKAYSQKCPAPTINYTPTSSGDGVTAFNHGHGRLRRLGRGARPDRRRDRRPLTKACGSTALDLPMVVGPIADRLQRQGRQQARPERPTICQDLPRQDHDLERPGDQGAELGCQPAVDQDHRRSTARTPRARRRTSRVPRGDRADGLHRRRPTRTPRRRASPARARRVRRASPRRSAQTDGGIGYVEYSYAVSAALPTAEIDNGGGPVALTHRQRLQGCRHRQGRRQGQTTSA